MSIGSIRGLPSPSHRLFGGPSDFRCRASPAGTSPRPWWARISSTQSPPSRKIEHGNFDFRLRPPAFRGTSTSHGFPGNELHARHSRGVCPGFPARELRLRLWKAAACCPGADRRGARLRSPHRRPSAEALRRTSMPNFRNTLTMPVSWPDRRRPSAHMRELERICAIAPSPPATARARRRARGAGCNRADGRC